MNAIKLITILLFSKIALLGNVNAYANNNFLDPSNICYNYIEQSDGGSLVPNIPKTIFKTNQEHIEDFSMWILSKIFGMQLNSTKDKFYNIYEDNEGNQQYIQSEGSLVFGSIFRIFNKVVLTVGLILLIYNVFFVIFGTVTKGELGDNYFLPFFFRIFLSILVLLPVHNDSNSPDSGYTYGQRTLMWLVGQGVGAANSVLTAGLCALAYDSNARISQGESNNQSNDNRHNYIKNIVEYGWLYAGFHYQDIFKTTVESKFAATTDNLEDVDVVISFEEVNSWIGSLPINATTNFNPQNKSHSPLKEQYHTMIGGQNGVDLNAFKYYTNGIMPLMGQNNGNSLGLLVMCKLQREYNRLPVINRYTDGYAFNPDPNNGYTNTNSGIDYLVVNNANINYEILIGRTNSNADSCGSLQLNMQNFKNYGDETLTTISNRMLDFISNQLEPILKEHLIWADNINHNHSDTGLYFQEFNNEYIQADMTCNDGLCRTDSAPASYEISPNILQQWTTSYGGFLVDDIYNLYEIQNKLISSTYDLIYDFKTILEISKENDLLAFEDYFTIQTNFDTKSSLDKPEPYLANQYLETFSYKQNTGSTKEHMEVDRVLQLYASADRDFAELNLNSQNISDISQSFTDDAISSQYLLASNLGPEKSATSKVFIAPSHNFVSGPSNMFSFGFANYFANFMGDMKNLQSGGSRSAPEVMAQNGKNMMDVASKTLAAFMTLQIIMGVVTGICQGKVPAQEAFQATYNFIYPVLTLMAGFLWLQGSVLGIVIPMIPILIWLVAICGWLFFVVEGMIAINLVALSMLWPNTQNQFLARAEPSIMLLLNIFLRPSLNILGLFGALIACNFAVSFFTTGVYMGFDRNEIYYEKTFGWMAAMTALIAIYFVLVKMSYSMIHILPDKVLMWISGQDARLEKADELIDGFKGSVEGAASKIQTLVGDAHSKANDGVGKVIQSSKEKNEQK